MEKAHAIYKGSELTLNERTLTWLNIKNLYLLSSPQLLFALQVIQDCQLLFTTCMKMHFAFQTHKFCIPNCWHCSQYSCSRSWGQQAIDTHHLVGTDQRLTYSLLHDWIRASSTARCLPRPPQLVTYHNWGAYELHVVSYLNEFCKPYSQAPSQLWREVAQVWWAETP